MLQESERTKQPQFTARFITDDEPDTRLHRKSGKQLTGMGKFRRFGIVMALASLLGMFLVVMGSAVTGNAQSEKLAIGCIGGTDWYGVVPVTTSSSLLAMFFDEETWQQSGPNASGITVITGPATVQHTPNEYYGSYFPFTSLYENVGTIIGSQGDLCGMPDGYLSSTVPTLLFGIGSALSSLMMAVYGWATNPTILNSLIAPIDCIVAGTSDGNVVSYNNLANFMGPADAATVNNLDSIYKGDTGNFVCNPGTEGLVNSLYLKYFVPVIFLGALWMFWQGAIKRRSTQTFQGLLWMILVGGLSIVFLFQPTFLAVKINDGVNALNNQLLESVLNTTVGGVNADGKTNNLCYLPALSPDVATNKFQAAELADVGPRQASCMLWKVLIYDAWANGQFGDMEAANTPLDLGEVTGGNNEEAAESAALRNTLADSVMNKFPDLEKERIPLALAQIDALVTDRDELIVANKTRGMEIDLEETRNLRGNNTLDYMNALKNQIVYDPQYAGWSKMWAGHAPSQRYSAAIVAVVGALVGGLVITVLGFVNVLYQLGMLLLILVAPLILLVGLHPGVGRRVATKWLEALLSTATKRILVSFLMVILIAVYSVIYTMDVGWLQKILLIAAVGIGILMYRKQLTQMVASVNIGSGGGDSFNQGAQQAQRRITSGATSSGAAMVGAAVAGGGMGAIAGAGARGATSGRGGSPMMAGRVGLNTGRAAAARSKAKKARSNQTTGGGTSSPRPNSGGGGRPNTGTGGGGGARRQPTGGGRPNTGGGGGMPSPGSGGPGGGAIPMPAGPGGPGGGAGAVPGAGGGVPGAGGGAGAVPGAGGGGQQAQSGEGRMAQGAAEAGVGAAQTAGGVASGNVVGAAQGVGNMAKGATNMVGGAGDAMKEELDDDKGQGNPGGNQPGGPRPQK